VIEKNDVGADNEIETDFDKRILGDKFKLRFIQLDKKFIQQWVVRKLPSEEGIAPAERAANIELHEPIQKLDLNIESIYKETRRNELKTLADEDKEAMKRLHPSNDSPATMSHAHSESITSRLQGADIPGRAKPPIQEEEFSGPDSSN